MPRQSEKYMTAAKKAAEVVFAAQQRAGQFDRAGKNSSAISIREVARQCASPEEGGRPQALRDAEDAALAAFVIWLAEAGFPALPIQVEETANYLRNLRGMPPVSEHFVCTWLADHPELQKKAAIKPVDL
ncbi:hypothetical protein ColLi_12349 [Colletotrichum liriopes]|uniref:Uncharacterized protein n=1 Tax=Colletotrichum liriopes TaxID=708192 RepID=A0AA37H042_9PEZI|nr:hypothetical protein ColLi_12349 [Colletotrichum liriopes]